MASQPLQNLVDSTDQLRSRLIKTILVVVALAIVAYIFRGQVLKFIEQPLTDKKLIFIHPTEAFFTYIKLSLFAGVLVSAPYILYQLIRVFSPLLDKSERFSKGFMLGLFSSGSLFFYVGVAFALLGVMPFAINFLKGISGQSLEAMFTVGNYVSFVIMFTLIFGFVFELPVVSTGLARLGLIKRKTLTSQWRLVLVGAAILAAVLTPPDPITQMFLWGPLLLLYGLSIVLVGFVEQKD